MFTISVWINPDVLRDFAGIVSKRQTGGVASIELLLGGGLPGSGGSDDIMFRVVNTSGEIMNVKAATAGNLISTGTWTHVAAVFDGTQTGDNASTAKIYINGTEQNLEFTGTFPGMTPANTADLVVGQLDGSTFFDGQIDEVRLYDRALSASEVLTLAQEPLAPQLVADFAASPDRGDIPMDVTFTDLSTAINTSISSYAWDFDNDGITDSTQQNPQHTYLTAGRFTVSLTVSDGTLSNTRTQTALIDVDAPIEILWEQKNGSNISLLDRVGIGTSNPGEALEVAGNIRTDDLQINRRANCEKLYTGTDGDVLCGVDSVGIRQVVAGAGLTATETNGIVSLSATGSSSPVANKTCPVNAYLSGFTSSSDLICRCLPNVIDTGTSCVLPVEGQYTYFVDPYGGCAGSGMDVRIERRFDSVSATYAYRATYKFRSDYAWQESFTTSGWFTSKSTFGWQRGRDYPNFSLTPNGIGDPLFTRGGCKGPSGTGWGFLTWTLSDANFN